jgi:hypothetical protein
MIQSQTVSAKFIPCRFLTMQLTIRNYAGGNCRTSGRAASLSSQSCLIIGDEKNNL